MRYIIITLLAILMCCLLYTPHIKSPSSEDSLEEDPHIQQETTEITEITEITQITEENINTVSEIHKQDGVYEYYFTQLQSNQHKTTYREIYNLIKTQQQSIIIETTSNQNIKDIIKLFRLVQLDHPEFYYVEDIKYIPHQSNKTVTIYPIYFLSPSEKAQADKELKEYTENFQTALESSLSKPYIDIEIEEFIYEYITTNTEYNINSNYHQTIYSVVQGESVCMGYTKMFKYLCDKNNIPSIIIRGETKEPDQPGHAWNKVYITNQWYIADLTIIENMLQDFNSEEQKYKLNITDELMFKQYSETDLSTPNIEITLPECNSIEKDWYNTKGLYITDHSQIENKIKEAQSQGQKEITIRCNSDETYQSVANNINNIAKHTNSSQTSLIKNAELRLIRIVWK